MSRSTSRRLARATLATCIAGCAAACAARAPRPDRPADAGACLLATAAETAADTVRIALSGPFETVRIGAPADQAERTLVANLYDTLVRIDCVGEPVPGLAGSWRSEQGGARWVFTLRPDARFWDGASITARDVAAAWSDRSVPLPVETGGVRARIRSLAVSDDRVLVVDLERARPVSFFADPALAVHRRAAGAVWPLGSGPYAVDIRATSSHGALRSVHVVRIGSRSVDPPRPEAAQQIPTVLHFAVPPSSDLRNALDAGADVVLTSDPAVLEYAAEIPGLTLAPLPWERMYLLLAPGAAAGVPPPPAALEGIARDAVRTEARPAPDSCLAGPVLGAAPANAPPRGGLQSRILYPQSDEAARGLAERLVALAASPLAHAWIAARLPARQRLSAVALDAAAFAAALLAGQDAGYVLGLTEPGCGSEALAGRAPWLAGAAAGAATALIETRAHAIVRDGLAPARVDRFGALRFGAAPPRRPQ
jgi:hypothetical protein